MIVGLYSPVPQSGKSTVCQMFQGSGFIKLSLAEPVKRTLHTMLMEAGVWTANEYLWGDQKGDVILELGVTGGYLMSTFDTNYIRGINPNFWLDILTRKVKPGYNYIVDDMRFPNEYALFDFRIKVTREQATVEHGRSKKSEGQLDNHSFDFIIKNDYTIHDLETRTREIIEQIL
jgi:hypothetical protein